MSWWTDFRDSALTSAGLKNGKKVGAAVGTAATQPTPVGPVQYYDPATGQPLDTAPKKIQFGRLSVDFSDPKLWLIAIGGYITFKKLKDGK